METMRQLNQLPNALTKEQMPAAKTISFTRYNRAGDIAEYIRACCREGRSACVSIAALARRFGICQSNVKISFKHRYHTSVHAFLQQEKQKQVRRLMDETRLSIKEIAVRTGYQDLSNFSRDFTKYHGVSPTHYRAERCAAKSSPAGEHARSLHGHLASILLAGVK